LSGELENDVSPGWAGSTALGRDGIGEGEKVGMVDVAGSEVEAEPTLSDANSSLRTGAADTGTGEDVGAVNEI
jgi:hypothetical protein